jgi:hypothetical protein
VYTKTNFKRKAHVIALSISIALSSPVLVGCKPNTLPTIGRTHGDLPMTLILQPDESCTKILQNVYFEAPFATGMSFRRGDCLPESQKVGRKTVAELTQMHASITFDGEFYIIKNGY